MHFRHQLFWAKNQSLPNLFAFGMYENDDDQRKNIAMSQVGNGSKCENRSFPSHTGDFNMIYHFCTVLLYTLIVSQLTALIVKVGKFTLCGCCRT